MKKFISWFSESLLIGLGAGVIYSISIMLLPNSSLEKRVNNLEKQVTEMQNIMAVED